MTVDSTLTLPSSPVHHFSSKFSTLVHGYPLKTSRLHSRCTSKPHFHSQLGGTPLTPSQEVRLLARQNLLLSTASLTNTIQTNLIVLPSRYAHDFRALCARNPISCPLLYTTRRGDPTTHLAPNADIRTDIPAYNVYKNGTLTTPSGTSNIMKEWSSDHVGFLIGCSYSFETALIAAGLPPRHVLYNPIKRVPMFKTSVPLSPAGVFTAGTVVVSMRSYLPDRVREVTEITGRFPRQHGAPIAVGWEGARALGIEDKVRRGRIDYGDWVEIGEGEVPLFWGCGVTPQVAVQESALQGVVMSHRPGCMFVTDVPEGDEACLQDLERS